ncbi:hypothetical protein IFM89_038254 [Coptis chinensis]|uniref:NET domain-containing protein n=1 Tax=Coptis chinensis TaxID=261450 RepID=A0A835H9K8_9MAGN|nr:hypothetical protein IFM89_038254 [Coptis chinensis]
MSVEEKRKLGIGLSRLSPDDLTKALEIIAHKNPSFQATTEEVDIDMDAQQNMQVNTSKKACAAVYPSLVQNKILWFWPSTDSQYKDVATKEKPPYIPELDDPSYASPMGNRDIPYGYVIPDI